MSNFDSEQHAEQEKLASPNDNDTARPSEELGMAIQALIQKMRKSPLQCIG